MVIDRRRCIKWVGFRVTSCRFNDVQKEFEEFRSLGISEANNQGFALFMQHLIGQRHVSLVLCRLFLLQQVVVGSLGNSRYFSLFRHKSRLFNRNNYTISNQQFPCFKRLKYISFSRVSNYGLRKNQHPRKNRPYFTGKLSY